MFSCYDIKKRLILKRCDNFAEQHLNFPHVSNSVDETAVSLETQPATVFPADFRTYQICQIMHWSWQPWWVNIFGLGLHCFFPSSSPLSSPGCELYAFCGALFGICSMMTLMVIAVDRYVVITRPLASLGVMSRRKALSIVAAAWVYSMGWSLPPFFGWSEYDLETVVIDQCDYSQGFSLLSAVFVLLWFLWLVSACQIPVQSCTIISNRSYFPLLTCQLCLMQSVISRQIASCLPVAALVWKSQHPFSVIDVFYLLTVKKQSW